MKSQIIKFPDQIIKKIKCLRKISPTDKFPCFNCFDDRFEKLNCKVCAGCGFVYGSHPMVQFSQDFIDKKINYLKKQQTNSSKQLLLEDDLNKDAEKCFDRQKYIINNSSINIEPQKPNLSNRDDYCSFLAKSKNMSEISSEQDNDIIRHNGYCCDYCKQDPIIGYRYHCQKCQDYDLCSQCYNDVSHEHEFIIFKQVEGCKWPMGSIGVLKQDFLFKNIRKSIRKK